MSGLQPIKAHLAPLVASSNDSKTSTDPVMAVSRAQALFGCYRRDDAHDPETYAAAISAVLAQYPPDVVKLVTDPRTGLPSRNKWLPNVAEVREACEAEMVRRRAAEHRKAAAAAQIAAREADKPRDARPTLDEIQARVGAIWPGFRVSGKSPAPAAMGLDELAQKYGIDRAALDAVPDRTSR